MEPGNPLHTNTVDAGGNGPGGRGHEREVRDPKSAHELQRLAQAQACEMRLGPETGSLEGVSELRQTILVASLVPAADLAPKRRGHIDRCVSSRTGPVVERQRPTQTHDADRDGQLVRREALDQGWHGLVGRDPQVDHDGDIKLADLPPRHSAKTAPSTWTAVGVTDATRQILAIEVSSSETRLLGAACTAAVIEWPREVQLDDSWT